MATTELSSDQVADKILNVLDPLSIASWDIDLWCGKSFAGPTSWSAWEAYLCPLRMPHVGFRALHLDFRALRCDPVLMFGNRDRF